MDPAKPLPLFLLPLLLVGSTGGLASASAQGNNLEICLLPLEKGPCRALIPRFYYDRNQQTCREFKYGGCLGNANNFHSLELCEHTCGNIEKVPTVCRLETQTYPCDKPNVQSFFNLSTMTCETLKPNLCSTTMNIFPDEDTCKDFCEPRKVPSFCSSPRDEGLCAANVTRYYFNSRNKTCETFTYTGCGGNENNFYYLDDCDRVCIKGSKALPIQSSGKGVE
ncbi:tissue factor pathway inhibitor 2 isoform X1 [Phodopus roborovskii]|uniref:tissue factor pathway inhibitor 2 isoform X1 n=1 Tax=Phodopus roborovskii TaxID=109678 RepID=UPI0021E41DBF|nr:tissue factor pathway inhibitor 2 isoform X1 [Phodopus roborovskii]